MYGLRYWIRCVWVSLCVLSVCLADGQDEGRAEEFLSKGGHTNNWAVLVSTSRFWFNYRHMANTLGMYRTVKRLGIPDSQIILMLADDIACNPRNVLPASIFNSASRSLDLYGPSIEVDYRGYEVTVENFIRLLTGRHEEGVPKSKRLGSDERSNVLVYMTGHGGDEFLKFQDSEEISAWDLADAFAQMWEKKRYHELLFMTDTCQANTLYTHFYSPNILATGSSAIGESSYSHHADADIGVAVIDRYTYYNLEFLEKVERGGRETLGELFEGYTWERIHSTAGVRTEGFARNVDKVRITDFFGGDVGVEVGVPEGFNAGEGGGEIRVNESEVPSRWTSVTKLNVGKPVLFQPGDEQGVLDTPKWAAAMRRGRKSIALLH
ncbi:hypothetical protein SAICODRAFT_56678 [Saitoella complicata NRRL Y-17804]|uniref:GPI-anchor transamidase n=1 Tax=Saitoella complicata (strain BCRC 22490 / CBS 7301 / JCM 7358 / NBRC 10748 / NRRL Y-17804) TaxID=698492 RepID=A0A0E9N956_SAICN|nr:uncharacterized protein SAICODRAFT_56678 [Saitoella complicata NRRL Y-17804]ODQ53130.1 hypothetical protein SAICODRAFT_56678 [Saitoella complicata NRRL Y-17804]GAO46251.1 hypothetical protein G7K_0486-t1 [Saitoella complicata NRRL Y-17804]